MFGFVVVFGEAYAYALGAVGGGARGGDPGHFAHDGVALGVAGQGDEHVNVIAQTVFIDGGDEQPAFGEYGDVGRVEGGFFLDVELNNAGTGAGTGGGGCTHDGCAGLGVSGGRQEKGRARFGVFFRRRFALSARV